MTRLRPEEQHVADLLKPYFANLGHKSIVMQGGDNPPDISCVVDGVNWAVEVTFANQEVRWKSQARARAFGLDKPLMDFGNEIGTATETERAANGLKYLLVLGWPEQSGKVSDWRKQVAERAVKFVKSGRLGTATLCKASGSELVAMENGQDWSVAIAPSIHAVSPTGTPLYDIRASLKQMLIASFDRKAAILANLSGYEVKCLALVNTYFFGDDVSEVSSVCDEILSERPDLGTFDRLMYVVDKSVCEVAFLRPAN